MIKKFLSVLLTGLLFNSMLYAGATFSRVKTWSSGEVLTASDLNAEFDNILNNLAPSGIDDYSSNSTDMRSTADPYPGLSESLATSLQGEIERLRYQILQVKKAMSVSSSTYWYEDLPSTGVLNVRNNSVGINKATPTFTLDVTGDISGTRLFTADGSSITGVATQTIMEQAGENNYYVSPGNFHLHPASPKAWVLFVGSGTVTILKSYNVSSVTDNGTGDYSINFTRAFSNQDYVCVGTTEHDNGTHIAIVGQDTDNLPTFNSWRLNTVTSGGSLVDPRRVNVVCYGDQNAQ